MQENTDNPAKKIREAFGSNGSNQLIYSYGDFVSVLQRQLDNEGVSLGENALGIKCFCREDNQDRLGSLLMSIDESSGWFDLNAFGAYPAGRSIESFGPPSHHIPERRDTQWTFVCHATHVGCDSHYTLGLTDRYGMRKPGSSCGLLAGILARHKDRKAGSVLQDLGDFEMNEVEKALLPHLDEISSTPYPMASAAEKLLELGSEVFDSLLRESGDRCFYIGGINVDYDAEHPENNIFVPKTICIYEDGGKREIVLQ
jgi:hypothetical protein